LNQPNPGLILQRGTGMTTKGIGHRLGVGIGCVLGVGLIALTLLWVLVQILTLIDRVTG